MLELTSLSALLQIHGAEILVPHDGQNLASWGKEKLQPGHLGVESGAIGMADGLSAGAVLVSGSTGGTSMNSCSCLFSGAGEPCS